MVARREWRPLEGDRVVVPWGFEHVPGTVVRIYGPPGRPTALVAVDLLGADGRRIGEHTVSFPLADLEPAGTEAAS